MGNNTQHRKEENLRLYIEEIKKWNRPIEWSFDMTSAMALVGAMQLALRHPNFTGPSSKIVREFVLQFRDSIPPEFPAIRETISMGMHRRYDE